MQRVSPPDGIYIVNGMFQNVANPLIEIVEQTFHIITGNSEPSKWWRFDTNSNSFKSDTEIQAGASIALYEALGISGVARGGLSVESSIVKSMITGQAVLV